ncbi:inovirus-type Gp2 protein [Acinetobacter baumannii]|uniref:YagK/YfjJ domain-containing protein n=1 Tax=Acinetobacter baumannii TaxID=470 RepID=UPI00389275B5
MKKLNYSKILICIEDFIIDVVEHGIETLGFYSEFAYLLIDFNEIYSDNLFYQGYLGVFVSLRYDFNVNELSHKNLVSELKINSFGYYFELFKSFKFRYINSLREFRKSEIINTESLVRRADSVLSRYSKVLVVRVDLSYLREFHHLNNIDDFKKDLSRLNKLIQNGDTIFKGNVDYAWAIEQGVSKGFHCHLVLFFNGHKRKNAFNIAKNIGKKWSDITDSEGTYFNCHDPKQIRSYEERGILGIDMIHRNDPAEIANMRRAICYLTSPEKEDQYLRVKTSKKMRTFG